MFGFDVFPVAVASLDMTADFAPLLSGLCALLGVSAAGIAVSAASLWLLNTRRPAAVTPVATASVNHAPQEQAKAA